MPTETLTNGSSENSTQSEGDSAPLLDQEFYQNWAMLRMGHEGMMLDKIQRQNRIVENSVLALQKDAGYDTSQPETKEGAEGDEMGVSIGNKITHEHHYQNTESKSGGGLKGALVGLAVSALLGPVAGVATHWFLNRDSGDPVEFDDTSADVMPGFGEPEWRE